MATRDDQDPNDPGGDWWSQNAPPAPTSTFGTPPPWFSGTTPPFAPGQTWQTAGPQVDQLGNTWSWNPTTNAWEQSAGTTKPPTGGGETTTTTPTPGLPTTGYGAPPDPYKSDPNAPIYDPLPTYVPPEWTGGDYVPPSVQDLQNSPGYQARMDAVLKTRNRAAAAQGTVLNGGTLIALDRDAQNFASNEYQTLNANTLDAYKQRYARFTDTAGRDLASRTVNANDNQLTYANRTSAYTEKNARTLSDYITNVTNKRNAELDYWNRLRDLNQTGSGAAGNSR